MNEMERLSNRARFLEEATNGILWLMEDQGCQRKELAERLGCSKSFVTRILEGSHNFTLETLADVYLALNRSVHLTLGTHLAEMRMPVDEGLPGWRAFPSLMGSVTSESETLSADTPDTRTAG